MKARHAALFYCALAIVGCDTNWIDPMEIQKKFVPFGSDEFFPDGRAMRPLVAGAVSREEALGPRDYREGVDATAHFVDHVPVPLTRALLERGRQRFEITCAACHGVRGDGHCVVAEKMSLRAPPTLVTGSGGARPPGEVFHIITHGWGVMAPYATEIPVDDRWAIVAYLQALRLSQHSSLDAVPPDVRRQLEDEKQ